MRAMTRYRGIKGDTSNGSATAAGPPNESEGAQEAVARRALSRQNKRKRSGFDEDTDLVPAVTAGRVGRVGRPDSPTW
jgi:hypothetical protein